jgi:hypothetical protein
MQNPEKTVLRANRAEQLMADPLIVEAKAHIEAELWRQFQRVAPSDAESLTFIKSMQYMHEKYFAFLNAAVSDGKLARLEIERKKKTVRERVFGR